MKKREPVSKEAGSFLCYQSYEFAYLFQSNDLLTIGLNYI